MGRLLKYSAVSLSRNETKHGISRNEFSKRLLKRHCRVKAGLYDKHGLTERVQHRQTTCCTSSNVMKMYTKALIDDYEKMA